MTSKPTNLLISRCLARDGSAWTELVTTHRAVVLRVLLRTVGVDAAPVVADLEQEIWSRLLASDGAALRGLLYAEPGAVRAFLCRMAANIGMDHRRRTAVRRLVKSGPLDEIAGHVADEAESVEDAYERIEKREMILDTLDQVLTPPWAERDRMIFRAHYLDGFTTTEISAMGVGLAPKGVETLIFRLVNKIRNLLRSKKEDAA